MKILYELKQFIQILTILLQSNDISDREWRQ